MPQSRASPRIWGKRPTRQPSLGTWLWTLGLPGNTRGPPAPHRTLEPQQGPRWCLPGGGQRSNEAQGACGTAPAPLRSDGRVLSPRGGCTAGGPEKARSGQIIKNAGNVRPCGFLSARIGCPLCARALLTPGSACQDPGLPWAICHSCPPIPPLPREPLAGLQADGWEGLPGTLSSQPQACFFLGLRAHSGLQTAVLREEGREH